MNKLIVFIHKHDLMSLESESIINQSAIRAGLINHLDLNDHDGLNRLYAYIKHKIEISEAKELSMIDHDGFTFGVKFFDQEVITCKSVKV